MKLKYIVDESTKYENLKELLKADFLLSDRLIIKLKQLNQILLNNEVTYLNHKITDGDSICVNLDFDESSDNIIPIKMDLDILYEDDALIAINKPPFMPVHPSMNHFEDSLSNGIKYYFESIGLKRKIRPINRLDKNTSGIVLFAKNAYIQECLVKQMKSEKFEKEYLALVDGIVDKDFQTINVNIARKENSIIERCVNLNGDSAITIVQLLKTYNNYSLVKCILKTGRTHQIRVHMKYINHPIVGDDLYGNPSNIINRQALHACKVSFMHPINKAKIEIKSELPTDIKKLI